MKPPSGETQLLIILAVIVLLGGGFLLHAGKDQDSAHPGPPPPTPRPITEKEFDEIFAKSRHVKGDAKARFAIIEFADFQCPSCRRAYEKLVGQFGHGIHSVQFAFRHKPLPNHEAAMPAAIASEAADKQGKFWQMYDALMDGVEIELDPSLVEKKAREVGLDMARLKQDSGSHELQKLVRDDIELADRLRVESTPTFLVKDRQKATVQVALGGKSLLQMLQGEPGVPTPEPEKKVLTPPGN